MKPKIVDLRAQRCPMTLLLAKRHAVTLQCNQTMILYISDLSSKNDIEKFLSCKGFHVCISEIDGDFSMQVTCLGQPT